MTYEETYTYGFLLNVIPVANCYIRVAYYLTSTDKAPLRFSRPKIKTLRLVKLIY